MHFFYIFNQAYYCRIMRIFFRRIFSSHYLVPTLQVLALLVLYAMYKNWSANNARFDQIDTNQQQVLQQLTSLDQPAQQTATDSAESQLAQELGNLKKRLIALESVVGEHDEIFDVLATPSTSLAKESSADSTPAPTSASSLQFVTIADKRWSRVDVFKDSNGSSTIIGQAVFGQSYPLVKQENGYYLIALKESQYGWIHKQFVKEY